MKRSRGGGTPLYGQYGYVRPQRVWFFRHIGHKLGIDFCTLVFNSVFFLEEATFSSRPPSPIRILPSSTPCNACYTGLKQGNELRVRGHK